MNTWRHRLLVGLLFWLIFRFYLVITEPLPNSSVGMFVFHIGAAFIDFMLLICANHLLNGKLSDDMQTLCYVSIVFNFLGWILYMAYAPPIFYNGLMGVLSYVQYLRLIMGDRHVDFARLLGNGVVRSNNLSRPKLHTEKAES